MRGPQSLVSAQQADFADPLAIGRQVDAICATGPVDIVLIAHGSLPDQAHCQADLQANQEALAVIQREITQVGKRKAVRTPRDRATFSLSGLLG